MDRSSGFGSTLCNYVALFRLAFASAPRLTSLNLAAQRNSPARSTKSTRSHYIVVLSLLVSIWFQVLFHSPPGVLFTFPSRYYTLSVTKSYLALGDGPPIFLPDFSCPAVLRIPVLILSFSPTRLSLPLVGLSRPVWLTWYDFYRSITP